MFDTIAAAARKLCAPARRRVLTFDGELHPSRGGCKRRSRRGRAIAQAVSRGRPAADTAAGRAILTRTGRRDPDVHRGSGLCDRRRPRRSPVSAASLPFRCCATAVRSAQSPSAEPSPDPFTDKQIALLKTFADQAVIAIENVRLFKELEARTTQLTRSVGELKALGEVGQAVSSTLDLETVLSTIVSRAIAACRHRWRIDLRIRRSDARSSTCARPTACRTSSSRRCERPDSQGRGRGGASWRSTGEPVEIRDIADERSLPEPRARDARSLRLSFAAGRALAARGPASRRTGR